MRGGPKDGRENAGRVMPPSYSGVNVSGNFILSNMSSVGFGLLAPKPVGLISLTH